MIIVFEKYSSGETKSLDSSLKTYLFGICQNLILKNHRRQDVRQRHMTRLKEHWLFDSTDSYTLDGMLESLNTALNKLQEPCKSIISLFYLNGMSLTEIADELSYKSTDVVKTQKSRCISTLKKALNGSV
jgi:RNA polymerase sigma-70 factor (ECF subfamily)